MEENKCKNNRGKRPQNQRKRGQAKGKKIEINVNDSDLNSADLPANDSRGSNGSNNDVSWYNHYPELLRSTSGINTGVPVGTIIDWVNPGVTNPRIANHLTRVPGIMTIQLLLTYGSAEHDATSPVNKVAAQLYQAMRQKLGSTASYDPSDIMLYLGALDSAYALYAFCAKVYGCARINSPFNRYYMEALVESLNVDWSSVTQNLAEFRTQINTFAVYLASFAVPSDMDIFKRHLWMLQNIFTDSATFKAQLYQYGLEYVYVYTEQQEGPASLHLTPISAKGAGSKITYDDLRNMMNTVLLSIQGSQDIVQMSADILKAFEGGVYRLNLIPEEYITPISYSQEVLMQIENSFIYGEPVSGDITVDADFATTTTPMVVQNLIMNPTPWYKELATDFADDTPVIVANSLFERILLNYHMETVSPEMAMVSTRNIAYPKIVTAGTGGKGAVVQLGSRGTEVLYNARIYTLQTPDDNKQIVFANTYGTLNYYNQVTGLKSMWATASKLQSFDWAPAVNYIIIDTAPGTSESRANLYRMQDIDNYAMIDNIQLNIMHECAVLSEFWSSKFPIVR